MTRLAAWWRGLHWTTRAFLVGALAAGGAHCTCAPLSVPLNADDDDGDGVEDRHQVALAPGEDDLLGFGAGVSEAAHCCCGLFVRQVRFTSIPPQIRIWRNGSRVTTGTAYGGPFSVEGVGVTGTGQVARIAYQILDDGGEVVASLDRTVAVRPDMAVQFSTGDMSGDMAVVVKRSSDPVRTNNATCFILAGGLADGRYRLSTDRGRFQGSDAATCDITLLNGAASAELYGVTPSAATGDATLALQSVEGTTFASTNYTVLWVDISMRCGQDDPFSLDNDCSLPTNRMLGAQISDIPGYEPSIGNVVEIVGQVHPPNFAGAVDFRRDNLADATFVLTTNGTTVYNHIFPAIVREVEPNCNDPCEASFCDGIPSQSGHVYNVDTPGLPLYFLTAFPNGNLFLLRLNFAQYAVFGTKRCSNDFFWFSRTTAIRASQGNHYVLEFYNRANQTDDNAAGSGLTPISQ